jgi:hypothetical protein
VRRVALLIALGVLAGAPLALAAGGSNTVVGNCDKSQVKPKSIILACADVNEYVNKITWKAFGGTTATGTGTFVENTCTPNCAAGKFKDYPVTLTLSNPKPCFDRKDDYRLISLTFSGARPPSSPAKTQQQLFCPVG